MIGRKTIVAEAREWLGTPYHHQARLRGVGVDCVGLVIGVARSLGIVAPEFDVGGYPRTPDGRSLLSITDGHMERIAQDAMQPGDVVVVCIAPGSPQHLGILGDYRHGGLSLIHAYNGGHANGVIETRLMLHSRFAFAAAYKFRGVD